LFGTFAVGECGVQNSHFVTEYLMQVGGDCWGEADLWDQKDSGAAGLEDSAHGG
jgi:hypothetical protein